jgi:hypothetical protein
VEVKATSTGKLLVNDNLPRNNEVAELCSGKFNVAVTALIRSENYQHTTTPTSFTY